MNPGGVIQQGRIPRSDLNALVVGSGVLVVLGAFLVLTLLGRPASGIFVVATFVLGLWMVSRLAPQ